MFLIKVYKILLTTTFLFDILNIIHFVYILLLEGLESRYPFFLNSVGHPS